MGLIRCILTVTPPLNGFNPPNITLSQQLLQQRRWWLSSAVNCIDDTTEVAGGQSTLANTGPHTVVALPTVCS